MPLRRTAPLAFAALALACQPSVPFDQTSNPKQVNYAAFDPSASPPSIPLPNDLAFLAIASQSPAQQVLLNTWATEGFPSDQEVPIAVDIFGSALDDRGNATKVAPTIDTTTIKVNTPDANVVVLAVDAQNRVTPVRLDTPKPGDYVVSGDHGTLSIHPAPAPNLSGANVRRWPPATSIIYALRAGSGAIDVTGGGQPIAAQPAMFFITHCCATGTLNSPQNQTLLPGATAADKAAVGAQLEQLRQRYLPAFAALDQSPIHHDQVAAMGTFKVAPARGPHVETDPGSGLMPLPSDFLFTNGHLSPDLAAPTGPFGALGAGLATLDGFSTTAMVLSQTSEPIDATTVANGAFIYEVGGPPTAPTFTRLKEIAEAAGAGTPAAAGYAAEPSPITQAPGGGACAAPPAPCVSTAIGLQPAVPAQVGGTTIAIPPLKENANYVVLITDNVKTASGKPLVRTTLSNIVFLPASISIASGGKSTVAGISDAQAPGFDQLRAAVRAAAAQLAVDKPGLTIDHVVLGYTFHTQSGIKSTATQLAALPYGPTIPATTAGPASGTTVSTYCSTCPNPLSTLLTNYGVDATIPTGNIGSAVEATIVTFNKLLCNAGDTTCTDTGAFNAATVAPVAEPIRLLVALPACTPSPPATVCTVPLAVFHHGLGGGRGQMLALADRFTAKGIAVAAIDANKHGDRSFCARDAECTGGGTCQAVAALAGEDPAAPHPGKCTTDFTRRPVSTTFPPGSNPPSGIPSASSNFLVSGNLFRTRDSLRQDIIDQSQLVRVLSPNPGCSTAAPPNAPNTCANRVFTSALAIQIDPSKIFFVGQSLGSIEGTVDVAANPRFSVAALNVGGGTVVDVFSDPTSVLSPGLNALLASIGITRNTPQFLQFVNVAKWILDPADPINFAKPGLTDPGLASPLSVPPGNPPASRPVLGQLALCDDTVTNTWNMNLYAALGLGPVAPAGTTSTLTTFVSKNPIGTPVCPTNLVKHGFLLDWATYPNPMGGVPPNIAQSAQDDIATFFTSGGTALPPPSRSAP